MADLPVTPGLPPGLGTVLKVGGAILTSVLNRGARKKLNRARALQRLNRQLANAQAKRTFIAQAKLARASVLAGAESTGGLDSSGTQGQLASVATQTETALLEQKIVAGRERKIGALVGQAGSESRQGQTIGTAADVAGDVLKEFF